MTRISLLRLQQTDDPVSALSYVLRCLSLCANFHLDLLNGEVGWLRSISVPFLPYEEDRAISNIIMGAVVC